MNRKLSILPCVLALGLSAVAPRASAQGMAQRADHEPVAGALLDPSAHCMALASVDFAGIEDAPTQVTGVKVVDATSDAPATCQVQGYVAPQVGFELRLPLKNWNGKLIELGCGGFCGLIHESACDDPARRGYACVVSDNGHKSTMLDALWAYDNPQAEIDHAYRAAHVTALAGKAIVGRYYGQRPRKSYFMGSSTGGRQAMIEAQRFPWDFDGIIAGVPSLSVTGIHMNLLWGNRVFTDRNGEPLFAQPDLDTLQRSVVAKCDLNDGIRDGLIGDPRACASDPAELQCSRRKSAECLTAAQIDAVKKLYSGALTSRGESIHMPAALRGSEATWLDWFSRMFSGNSRATYNFVREEFRYSAFDPDAGPGWKPEDFDFDRDYQRLGAAESLSAAVNPDLRKFKAAGGKLLMYAGWSDAAGMPLHTVDYYEATERVLGGRAATQEFFRLFMIPAMGHGPGGGASVIDWLSHLEAWVERGEAPDKLIGAHVKLADLRLDTPDGLRQLQRRVAFPLDPTMIEYSRPLYPYPVQTKYLGRGDPRDAASFGEF